MKYIRDWEISDLDKSQEISYEFEQEVNNIYKKELKREKKRRKRNKKSDE